MLRPAPCPLPPPLPPWPCPGAAFTCLETAFRLDALHRQMKLLGEDSPVSKLQVKLEPGTHCCQDLLQALQTSPHRTSLPTLSSVPSWIPAKARPGQEPPAPGRPPVGSLSLPAPLPGSEHPSPWCVGPQCPPPQPLRQSRPHHCTSGASGCVRDSSPRPLLLCSLTPVTPRSHRTQEGQSTTQSWGVLAGVNPSHLMNLFTYEKGYCFVYYLSQLCGDPQRFDDFLRVSSPSCPTRSSAPRAASPGGGDGVGGGLCVGLGPGPPFFLGSSRVLPLPSPTLPALAPQQDLMWQWWVRLRPLYRWVRGPSGPSHAAQAAALVGNGAPSPQRC